MKKIVIYYFLIEKNSNKEIKYSFDLETLENMLIIDFFKQHWFILKYKKYLILNNEEKENIEPKNFSEMKIKYIFINNFTKKEREEVFTIEQLENNFMKKSLLKNNEYILSRELVEVK